MAARRNEYRRARGLSRASVFLGTLKEAVDGWVKPGHDGKRPKITPLSLMRIPA
jgi:hypothetical protein